MRDYIYIGECPPNEECAGVGSTNYTARAMKECRVYIKLIRHQLGNEPGSAKLAIKACPHDFGTYHTVVCYYDPKVDEEVNYALKCESEGPIFWDVQSKIELGLPIEDDILALLGKAVVAQAGETQYQGVLSWIGVDAIKIADNEIRLADLVYIIGAHSKEGVVNATSPSSTDASERVERGD